MALGFGVLILAGICQGSFGIGYKKYNPLSWEAFWGIYSTYCFIVPLVWAFLQVPDFLNYLSAFSWDKICVPIACGFLWGVSAIGFSKSVNFIGISLVYGLSMGVSSVVGSIIPLFGMAELPSVKSFIFLSVGMIITLFGIFIITRAGMLKDKVTQSTNGNKSMKLGLALALLSGLGSGAMNVGFNYSSDIGSMILQNGYSETGASAIQWLLVLFGGFVSSAGYCVIMLFKKKTWHTFRQNGSVKRLGILFLTCIIWFSALASYGIASILIGDMGSVIGWILFNALALIISSIWGLKTGEWSESGKAKKVLMIGNAALILSWVFIAFV